MLNIDLTDNNLIVSNLSCLNSYQSSQLEFWGFTKQNNSYFVKLVSDKILVKSTDYFKKENIGFFLSPSCQAYYLRVENKRKAFFATKQLAKDFKNGIFDNESWETFCKFIDNNLKRSFKIHQLKAAYHHYLLKNGANFSVPGSGKTSVVLSVYEKLKEEGKVNILFVAGPPSSFGPWKKEFTLTTGKVPNTRILAGGLNNVRKNEYFSPISKAADLYLTTYQTLLNDQDEVINFFKQNEAKVFFVIDEAHYMKQLEGNWAKAILRIAKHSTFRSVLTGTPIPKNFTDIFNLFDFLWPDDEPLNKNQKMNIMLHEKNGDEESAKALLTENIGPLFYRVRKEDLGLKIPKFHEPYLIEMNTNERLIYDAITSKIITYSKDDYLKNIDLKNIDLVKKLRRGRMIRLRQAACYAKLLINAIEGYDEALYDPNSGLAKIISNYDDIETPAKLEFLITLVAQLQKQGQKTIIWSNFIGVIELISKTLTTKGFYNKRIYGKTPIEQTSISQEETREAIRNEFVDPKSKLDVLIANPAACAESISLHQTCHHAIYYDLSYNCAQYLQSLDRIHRVGGSENITANYHYLQYKKSIDQDIKTNLEAKSKRMYNLIEQDYSIYSLDMFQDDAEIEAYSRLFSND